MATPKSANERIRRKMRKGNKKKSNAGSKDMPGRIVSKKPANNDPHRNRRHLAKEFLEYYRGNSIDNPRKFKRLIEDLIDVAVIAANEVKFPLSIDRLSQMREEIDDADYAVIRNEDGAHLCPVCGEEIVEKSTVLPEDQRDPGISSPEWVHSLCGGRLRYPPLDKENNSGRGEY